MMLLPSFPCQDLLPDGKHLTPVAGLHYILHLFDQAEEAINLSSQAGDVQFMQVKEQVRHHEDRVSYLESRHVQLNRAVDHKIAVDAEEADFRENVSNLDLFVISGLPRLSPDLVGKPWQDAAVRDVQDFLKLLMGRTMNVHYVKNSTARHKDAEVKYTVRMKEISESKQIRDKFGLFFTGGGGDKRPQDMKPYSVRNRITPGTQVRISVLQVLARRYKVSNPGSKVQVIGYDPRPILKITPASGSQDMRMKTYNYIDAVKSLPTNFTDSELDFIFQKVNPKLCGQLRSIFICLSDDVFRKKKIRSRPEVPADESEANVDADDAGDTRSASVSSGRSESSKSSGKGRKNHKRGASSPPDSAVPPKK